MKLEIPAYDSARVLVVGDVMLDRYLHGDTSRISPEAPVPVVLVGEEEERPGGAGNVALNIAALGAQVCLLGVTGRDPAADRLRRRLEAAGVECVFDQADGPTVTKLRVLSRHQQLIRLDFEDGFGGYSAEGLLSHFERLLADSDVVVLSDYGKGALRDPQPFIRAAREAGVPVLVDPKGDEYGRYRGASVVTPNLGEFEGVAGRCHRHDGVVDEDDLVDRAHRLMQSFELEALLVTRSEHGMTLLRAGAPVVHLPTRAREVFDVTGAGDTVISVLAASMAAGVDMEAATALSNLAAGLVVGKLGAANVSVPELRRALQVEQEAGTGVLTEDRLMESVEIARANGERLVMTNGCFDILHAGHVQYLEQAKRQGDRLIVAVNDDESVRELKGEGRPVNGLDRRMAVLAALGCVDWVVAFSETTPERLICKVLPDVLVKGGDYRPEEIAGGECVRRHGGEVVVLDYVQGASTSEIIAKLRESRD